MNVKSIQFLLATIFSLVFLLKTNMLLASPVCGDLWHTNGPHDYRDSNISGTLKMVESHHFTKEVEQLISGSTGLVGQDIDFVLKVFPNHHRALDAMSRLSLRDKKPQPPGASYSALCYFDRAVRFRPDDAMVRSIFSSHLLKINKLDLALEQLQFAAEIEPGNPTTSYNLGLLYFKKKDYDKALLYAKKAYERGFPLQGLRNQLKRINKWH